VTASDTRQEFGFRFATPADADALVALVNSAYRGDSSRTGWTTEADILGGQRTDSQEIAGLITEAGSLLLLCERAGEIVGSVHLQRQDADTAYLGMLVIRPGLQGQGWGSRLMTEAERLLQDDWGIARVQMQVITLRHALIAFYERRGYSRTGQFKPFPGNDPRFGLPKVADLQFEVLEKDLRVARTGKDER
jgi:ribosomal protein S18 acetylase RimI-like enzyme